MYVFKENYKVNMDQFRLFKITSSGLRLQRYQYCLLFLITVGVNILHNYKMCYTANAFLKYRSFSVVKPSLGKLNNKIKLL